ncbi:unnamed protein product [Urochloa decumbens]|uniref:Uncharacterized protein n=1 Tax=Urochloa decumbens TaxID=240449 RepID=A0ABC9A688_9POAL
MDSGGGGELLPRPDGPSSVVAKPGDGRGGWRAALFVVAVGFFERIGFVGVSANLIMYLTGPLGMSTAAAAAGVNAWSGTVLVLPLVGALVADSRLGRYRALLAAGVLYLLSLGMLTASSMMQTASSPPSASPGRLAFFYVALYLLALAQGFYGPCGEAFGADQFAPSDADPSAPAFRSSYFNWFHFSLSWGYAIATAALSYVQDNAGWPVGFGVCWAAMGLYLVIFLLGTPTYRAKQPADVGPFAEAVRAWAARVFRRKDDSTRTERLVAGQREDGLIVKLLPIWLTSIVFAAIFSQVSTLFTKQASTLDRRLGTSSTGLVVPPAALQCLTNITFIVMLPLYDRVIVPLARRLTGHAAGITMLQRIGASMAAACAAMAVAALVEAKRLRVARDAGLVDRPDVGVPMSLWWMIPQYVLIGLAGVLGQVGLEEFFYDQVPDALRSVGLALCLSIFGVGNYASSALVSAIDWATRSKGESWFSDNLNRAHLDYFYWLLAGLAALEVAAFLCIANRYVYRNKGANCDT